MGLGAGPIFYCKKYPIFSENILVFAGCRALEVSAFMVLVLKMRISHVSV